jgi:hypothetical protein
MTIISWCKGSLAGYVSYIPIPFRCKDFVLCVKHYITWVCSKCETCKTNDTGLNVFIKTLWITFVFCHLSAWLCLFVVFHFVTPMQFLLQNPFDAPQKTEKCSVCYICTSPLNMDTGGKGKICSGLVWRSTFLCYMIIPLPSEMHIIIWYGLPVVIHV